MYRFLLSVILLSVFTQSSIAQNIHIVDVDGNPLPGVEVNGGMTGITDPDGLLKLNATAYPVTIQLKGMLYEPTTLKIKNDRLTTIVLNRKKNSLQETVVTGVPRPTRLQNALSQYRVISRTEFQAQGSINVADALATRLNINIGNDQVLGSTIKVQGLAGNKVKILIDGLPVNGREGGNVDLSQLNLNNIERIETVQGPMSVVYGSDALGGVINLITRKTSKPWEASAGFNYESIGKYNADFNVSRKWDKHQILIGGGRNFFKGWNDIDTTPGIPHRRLEWKPKEQYFANATYNYTAKSGFNAQLATDYMREKITDAGPAEVSSIKATATDAYYRTNRLNNRLVFGNKTGKNGRWESRNSYALYYRTRETVVKNLVTLEEPLSIASGVQDTSRYDDITLRSNYSNILGKLKYDVGYDISLQRGVSGKIPDGSKHVNDYALYQNLSYAFLKEKLTLQGSLRESYNTHYSAPLIYSVQALYTPAEKIQVRASFANGFRAPTLKEQYLQFIDNNHEIYGNENLKAETGNHLQASVSYQPYQKEGNYVQVVVSGFYNDVNNQIALAKVNPDIQNDLKYKYSNITHLRNAIANVQVEQQWGNLNLVLEYGFTHTYGQHGTLPTDSNYDAYNASELTARANYYWKAGKINFNAFYKFTGASANIADGIDGVAYYNGTINSYDRLDASLSRKFWNKKIEIIAGIKNIFDVRMIGGTALITSSNNQAHTGSTGFGSMLPRSFFTTVHLNLN